jgi:LPXTG-motif cell wall-anchored protein
MWDMRKVSVLLLVSAFAIALALPASGQPYPGTTSTTAATTTTVAARVLGESLTRPEVAPQVLGASQTQPESGGGLLPRTGAAIATWALVGALLVALGTSLVLANRRRRPTTQS